MIVDARHLPPGHRLDFDVCIVGGGPAGISLALELADSSRRVCILESGGLRYDRDTQAMLDGQVLGATYPDLRETRLSILGGSTALWAGWCRPLDPIDFEAREWVPHSGWPVSRDELIPYYRRAHRLCGLGPFEYDSDVWTMQSVREPLPLSGNTFTHSVVHISPVCFGTVYKPALDISTTVDVLLHAPVLRLNPVISGEHIESVHVKTLAGNDFDVAARSFVLAAGGIENARLLLLSGGSPERSVGNGYGQVGRFFMEHGFINSGSFVASKPQSLAFHFPHVVQLQGRESKVRGVLGLNPDVIRRERLLNCAMFFHPGYESHAAFDTAEVRAMLELWEIMRKRAVPGAFLRRARTALRSPANIVVAIRRKLGIRNKAARRWRIRALFECLPNPDNRVCLSDERDALGRPKARVKWQVGERDLQSVIRAHQLLDETLRRSQLGSLELRFPDEPSSWKAAVEGGKHHMGATRMHRNPKHGVVDADCRVHGTANLYVAGSSVFPTGGFANPTLTIVALAARLAAHLKSRIVW